jgi:hypothetical protein
MIYRNEDLQKYADEVEPMPNRGLPDPTYNPLQSTTQPIASKPVSSVAPTQTPQPKGEVDNIDYSKYVPINNQPAPTPEPTLFSKVGGMIADSVKSIRNFIGLPETDTTVPEKALSFLTEKWLTPEKLQIENLPYKENAGEALVDAINANFGAGLRNVARGIPEVVALGPKMLFGAARNIIGEPIRRAIENAPIEGQNLPPSGVPKPGLMEDIGKSAVEEAKSFVTSLPIPGINPNWAQASFENPEMVGLMFAMGKGMGKAAYHSVDRAINRRVMEGRDTIRKEHLDNALNNPDTPVRERELAAELLGRRLRAEGMKDKTHDRITPQLWKAYTDNMIQAKEPIDIKEFDDRVAEMRGFAERNLKGKERPEDIQLTPEEQEKAHANSLMFKPYNNWDAMDRLIADKYKIKAPDLTEEGQPVQNVRGTMTMEDIAEKAQAEALRKKPVGEWTDADKELYNKWKGQIKEEPLKGNLPYEGAVEANKGVIPEMTEEEIAKVKANEIMRAAERGSEPPGGGINVIGGEKVLKEAEPLADGTKVYETESGRFVTEDGKEVEAQKEPVIKPEEGKKPSEGKGGEEPPVAEPVSPNEPKGGEGGAAVRPEGERRATERTLSEMERTLSTLKRMVQYRKENPAPNQAEEVLNKATIKDLEEKQGRLEEQIQKAKEAEPATSPESPLKRTESDKFDIHHKDIPPDVMQGTFDRFGITKEDAIRENLAVTDVGELLDAHTGEIFDNVSDLIKARPDGEIAKKVADTEKANEYIERDVGGSSVQYNTAKIMDNLIDNTSFGRDVKRHADAMRMHPDLVLRDHMKNILKRALEGAPRDILAKLDLQTEMTNKEKAAIIDHFGLIEGEGAVENIGVRQYNELKKFVKDNLTGKVGERPAEVIENKVKEEKTSAQKRVEAKEELEAEKAFAKMGLAEQPIFQPGARGTRKYLVASIVTKDGTLYTGKDHGMILTKNGLTLENVKEKGFILPNGKHINAKEAMKWVKENQPEVYKKLGNDDTLRPLLYQRAMKRVANVEKVLRKAKEKKEVVNVEGNGGVSENAAFIRAAKDHLEGGSEGSGERPSHGTEMAHNKAIQEYAERTGTVHDYEQLRKDWERGGRNHGVEHNAFFIPERNVWRKWCFFMTDGIRHYLRRLELCKKIPGYVHTELIGFTKNENGKWLPVTEQPALGNRFPTWDELDEHFAENGWIGEGGWYKNPKEKIMVTDLANFNARKVGNKVIIFDGRGQDFKPTELDYARQKFLEEHGRQADIWEMRDIQDKIRAEEELRSGPGGKTGRFSEGGTPEGWKEDMSVAESYIDNLTKERINAKNAADILELAINRAPNNPAAFLAELGKKFPEVDGKVIADAIKRYDLLNKNDIEMSVGQYTQLQKFLRDGGEIKPTTTKDIQYERGGKIIKEDLFESGPGAKTARNLTESGRDLTWQEESIREWEKELAIAREKGDYVKEQEIDEAIKDLRKSSDTGSPVDDLTFDDLTREEKWKAVKDKNYMDLTDKQRNWFLQNTDTFADEYASGPGAKTARLTPSGTPIDWASAEPTPVEKLTEAMGDAPIPTNNIDEAITMSRRIGQGMAAQKDMFSKAVDGMKGVYAWIREKAKDTKVMPDFKNILGINMAEDTKASLEAVKLAKKILKAMPNKLQREAIWNWIEAAGDEAYIRDAAKMTTDKYKKGWEAALKLTPEEKYHAQNVRKYFDTMLNDAIANGMLKEGVTDYIMRIVKPDSQIGRRWQAEVNAGLLKRNPTFIKRRMYETILEGERAGVNYVKDVGQSLVAYTQSFMKAMSARRTIRDLLTTGKASDGKALATIIGGTVPTEKGTTADAYIIKPKLKPEAAFAENGDPYMVIDHPALREWKWVGTDVKGNAIIMQGDVAVHPEIYKHLKAVLSSSGIRQFKVGRALMSGIREFKSTLLSLSGFHQVQEGLHAIFHAVKPWDLPELDMKNETQYKLVKGGLMVYDHNALENFAEGVAGTGMIQRAPLIGPVMHKYNTWLFSEYIPRLKMKMALAALERNTKRYSKTHSEEAIYFKTASQANAAFGELNYRMLARSQTFQDAMRMITLAPDFLEARTRFVTQAMRPGGMEQRVALLRGALGLYIGARIVNMIIDGDPHTEKPLSIVYGGKEFMLRSVPGDLVHLFSDPRSFVYHRLNPTFTRTMIEAVMGRDALGRRRYMDEQVKDFVQTHIPIPLQGLSEKFFSQRDRKIWESALNSLGVSTYDYHSTAEGTARKIVLDKGPFTYTEHSKKVNDLLRGIDRETITKSDIEKQLSSGEISRSDYRKILKEHSKTNIQRSIEHLDVEDIQKVWNDMTESEKREAKPIVRKKVIHHYMRAPANERKSLQPFMREVQ